MVRRTLSPEYTILGLLMERPMHGYELSQRFQSDLGQVWNVGLSHIYALLKKLEEAGLVEATREMQANRPPRQVYHITQAGCDAFLRWVGEPVESIRQIRLEFLAKLYFCHRMGSEAVRQLVDRQLARCRRQLERLRQAEADIPASAVFDHLILSFRIRQIEAIMAWMESYPVALEENSI